MKGELVAIYVAERKCIRPRSLPEVEAVAGRGLEGDRYFIKAGCFSNYPGRGRHVTLIAAEVLESLPESESLDGAEARRNLVTRGVELNSLVSCFFKVGDVVLRGDRLCHPCEHLEALTKRPVLRSLKGRGGLRADIIKGGPLQVGQALSLLSSEEIDALGESTNGFKE